MLGNENLTPSLPEILVSRGRLFVRDLGSTNGTRVNGRYLSAGEEARLRPGQAGILANQFNLSITTCVNRPGQWTIPHNPCLPCQALYNSLGHCFIYMRIRCRSLSLEMSILQHSRSRGRLIREAASLMPSRMRCRVSASDVQCDP